LTSKKLIKPDFDIRDQWILYYRGMARLLETRRSTQRKIYGRKYSFSQKQNDVSFTVCGKKNQFVVLSMHI